MKILYTCLTAGEGLVSSVALSRLGQPEDIAAINAFLAVEDGRWHGGRVLVAAETPWASFRG